MSVILVEDTSEQKHVWELYSDMSNAVEQVHYYNNVFVLVQDSINIITIPVELPDEENK